MMEQPDMEYVGFWPRVGAMIIDSILIAIVTFPLLTVIYGSAYWNTEGLVKGPADFLISWVLPAVAIIWLWVETGQTPGKMAIGARIVDAETGRDLTISKAMLRYLGYFMSMFVIFIGYIWVGFDPKKQGWHDHIAGTVVIRKRDRRPEPVRFRD
jgi:uncharacterized RDD family membrane protein YckC